MKYLKSILTAVALSLISANVAASVQRDFIALDVNGNGMTDFSVFAKAVNLEKGNCNVLIHGNTANHLYFFKAVKYWYAQNQCVVTFDLPGHGLTENVSNWNWVEQGSFQPLLQSLKTVVAHYNLNDYTVTGWSLGGDIALQSFNAGHLPGLNGIALIGTAPLDFLGRDLPSPSPADSCAKAAVTGQYNLSDLTVEQTSVLTDSFFKDCQAPSPIYPIMSLLTEKHLRAGILSSILAGQVTDEVSILSQIDVPVFFGYGSDDAWVNGQYMQTLVDEGYFSAPVTHKVFDGVGHAVATEVPYEFVDSFNQWRASL